METLSQKDITGLLLDWGSGDKAALDKLIPLVYKELRRMAHQYMRRERAGNTLQTSALINEAYIRPPSARVPLSLLTRRSRIFALLPLAKDK